MNRLNVIFDMWLAYCQARSSVIRNVKRDMSKYYDEVEGETHNIYDWLPHHQFEWFLKNAANLDIDKKPSVAIPAMYTALQKYLSTFKELKQIDIDIEINNSDEDASERAHFLEDMELTIELMMPRLQTAINTFNLDRSVLTNTPSINKGDEWSKKPDRDTLLLQEFIVLRMYIDFTIDSVKIIGNLYKQFCYGAGPDDQCHDELVHSTCFKNDYSDFDLFKEVKLRNSSTTKELEQLDTLNVMWLTTCRVRLHLTDILQPRITKLYDEVKDHVRNTFDWLPHKQFKWFENNAARFDKDKKVSTMFPIMHVSLLKYKTIFEQLLEMDVQTHVEAYQQLSAMRKEFFRELLADIRRMIYDIIDAIDDFELDKSVVTNSSILTPHEGWTSSPDYTTLLVQDWTVARMYTGFVIDYMSIQKIIFQDFCKPTSRKHPCHEEIRTSPCFHDDYKDLAILYNSLKSDSD